MNGLITEVMQMKIGVCGIACEVCGLYIRNLCDDCGPGTAEHNKGRIERLGELGLLCPVLECEVSKGKEHCSKDCNDFPCDKYNRLVAN